MGADAETVELRHMPIAVARMASLLTLDGQMATQSRYTGTSFCMQVRSAGEGWTAKHSTS